MKNKEKFAKEILDMYLEGNGVALNKKTNKPCSCIDIECGDCKFYDGDFYCRVSRKEWAEQEYVEPILTDKEKDYLSGIIKPFRNKINYIAKYECFNMEYIHINIESICTNVKSHLEFPFFDKSTMYKGMEVGKKYTLEELGL